MQAQKKIEKGSLLGEAHYKDTSRTIKEVTPFGIELEANQAGEFTGGTYNAVHNSTTRAIMKNDGTYEWESRGLQSTTEGDIIVGNGHGTGRMTGPKSTSDEGEVVFMTQSPRLSWLNNKKFRIETEGDMSTGEYHSKFTAL